MVSIRQNQYILLPREGLRATAGPSVEALNNLPSVRSTSTPVRTTLSVAGNLPVTVIDTLDEVKLVEIDEATAAILSSPDSPVRAERVIEYELPDHLPRPMGGPSTAAAEGAMLGMAIRCIDAVSEAPVVGAKVIALTSFAQRKGDEGVTNNDGTVLLTLSGTMVERLYVSQPRGYWGILKQAIPIQPSIHVELTPVDLTWMDCVRYYYGSSRFNQAAGVQVGILDTGVGPHPDLNVVSGMNTVPEEPRNAFQDGGIHGTHVAGIVGSNGAPPTGLRGIAPGVDLRAYRVFNPDGVATNYSIVKAMILAATERCDIINLSLGGGPYDRIVEDAIRDARIQGMLVVIAAGNDGRKIVSYPAAYKGATAVTAMGREGLFPAGSIDEGAVLRPPQNPSDLKEFIAEFSNIGPEVAVTAPGVGVLSTLPGSVFGPMSGTSMAAPAVAGVAASLLSQNPEIFAMPRDQRRSDAMERLLQANCVRRQFGAVYEGYGLPDPAVV